MTFVAGAALSLYWIDFNLYLASLGLSTATIGVVSTIASIAGAAVAFPASAASDRFGRRTIIAAGIAVCLVGLVGLLLTQALALIVVFAALWSVGQQSLQVVQAPFLTEHSEPEHRNELFAAQFAIQNVTNVVAAVLGAVGAAAIASLIGLDPKGPGTYRVILVVMVVLLVASLAIVALLTDDRPRVAAGPRLVGLGEPAAFPPDPRRSRARLGIVIRDRGRFARLLFPGLLISIGAGQVIPFLNIFIQRKFGLDLTSLNAVFAFTSLGTVAAILAQPTLARRFGQITSVVIVQAASIPFLAVLGFSPLIWLVILAMAVRNSLMNAGNPIFTAFAMEQVTPAERASLSAAMSVLWQIGWVIGGTWYAVLQAVLGFEAGYTVNFVTIITLYSIATGLYWIWFRAADRRALATRLAA
ncbi:MAG TPA: MFS transporter [Candidatus Limnocylindrales bacterium]|nr:MFS transporter [Candidatus Limnocylindrales bacterium]